MFFNSFTFLFFFAVVYFLFYILPSRFRWILLLISSYIFYMNWEPAYIILILISTFLDYFIGLEMPKSSAKKKWLLLILSLITNLGILFFFKYFNFFTENIYILLNSFDFNLNKPTLNVLLPVGISFYTFQTLSYTIDVFKGKMEPEKHLGKFALYVSFFPQLVAGPIERAKSLLPQLQKNDQKINYENFVVGLTQVLHGLFKKVVVADTLAIYVDSVYNNYEAYSGFPLLFATYLFAFQIYCDFSGYSDMAIGCARMLGYKFMDNFKLPYFSKSVTEFWRRWHISLSSWLKDYLYISLGGNRNGNFNTYRNLMITMLLGGLWHGASWNFIFWGFLNGLFLAAERILNIKSWNLNSNWLKKITFSFICFNLICLTWIYFRAYEFDQANYIVKNIVWSDKFLNFKITDIQILLNIGFAVVCLLLIDFFVMRKNNYLKLFKTKHISGLVAFNIILLVIIILFGVSEGTQFIYFQF